MKNGQRYSRDYVIDYTSNLKARDLMVYAHGEYEQSHTYRGDERVMQITNRANNQERLLYVHEDLRGTTRFYSKSGGQVFEELNFDAWGFPTSPNKLINNDHGNFITASFTGHGFDVILDLYFAQARFYDAQNRQWISRDPIKDSLNWYKYCNNNPKTYVDPTGLFGMYFNRMKTFGYDFWGDPGFQQNWNQSMDFRTLAQMRMMWDIATVTYRPGHNQQTVLRHLGTMYGNPNGSNRDIINLIQLRLRTDSETKALVEFLRAYNDYAIQQSSFWVGRLSDAELFELAASYRRAMTIFDRYQRDANGYINFNNLSPDDHYAIYGLLNRYVTWVNGNPYVEIHFIEDALGSVDRTAPGFPYINEELLFGLMMNASAPNSTAKDLIIGGAAIAAFAAIYSAQYWIPALGASSATAAPAAPAIQQGAQRISPNKLHHIFGRSIHNLSGFLNSFGGNQSNAYNAVQNALNKLNLPPGIFVEVPVVVNGYVIHCSGIVQDGVVKIGTFFIK